MNDGPAKIVKKPKSATTALDKARLEALFASIGEGIISTDEQGMITRVNQVALSMLGMQKKELLHKHFLSVITAFHENGQPIDVYDRPIIRAFQSGSPVSSRTLYKRKDGSYLPAQVTVSPIIYNGKPIGAIEVFRDLTNEIESDKLKSDFISIASHQLRTPLSAINMYTMMLRDGAAGSLTEDQLPYVDTVLSSVRRMNTLIDTLLNITRIEAGGIIIKPQPIELDNLSREMFVEFIPAAQAKNIDISANIAPMRRPVTTDSLLIKEVCANLLSNAIKYTPDGGSVEFVMSETPSEIHWSVTDSGYGIPEASQKNIFVKFYRAENITKKDVSGTGLGLYLIKNIAEALGGELWFESTENVGSTFHFTLPKKDTI